MTVRHPDRVPFDPSQYKNLSPEVDLTNHRVYLAAKSLLHEGVDLIEECIGSYVESIQVTKDYLIFKQKDKDRRPGVLIHFPIPKGLYDHLIDLSRSQFVPYPPQTELEVALEKEAAYLDRFQEIAFGPGTVDGQQVWVGYLEKRLIENYLRSRIVTLNYTEGPSSLFVLRSSVDPTSREVTAHSNMPHGQTILGPVGSKLTPKEFGAKHFPEETFKYNALTAINSAMKAAKFEHLPREQKPEFFDWARNYFHKACQMMGGETGRSFTSVLEDFAQAEAWSEFATEIRRRALDLMMADRAQIEALKSAGIG